MAKQWSDNEKFIARELCRNMSSAEISYWLEKSGYDRSPDAVGAYLYSAGLSCSKEQKTEGLVLDGISKYPGLTGNRLCQLLEIDYRALAGAVGRLTDKGRISVKVGCRHAHLYYPGSLPEQAVSLPKAPKTLADLGAMYASNRN